MSSLNGHFFFKKNNNFGIIYISISECDIKMYYLINFLKNVLYNYLQEDVYLEIQVIFKDGRSSTNWRLWFWKICQNCRLLKYCHGDVKDAYFAHLNNANCDYAKFDSEISNEMRTIRTELFNAFKEKGCNVRFCLKKA